MSYHSPQYTPARGETVDHGEQVLASLDAGLNCAESMVAAFAGWVGIPRETGIRAATGFGAGMGRAGSVCGLVSGGVLILGWAFGRTDSRDEAAKERAYCAVAELLRAVRASCGSILCTDLIGVDLTTEEGRHRALEEELLIARCRATAEVVAEILDRILGSSVGKGLA